MSYPAKKKVIIKNGLNVTRIFFKVNHFFSRFICLNYNSNVWRFCITESSPQRVKVDIWDYHTDSFPKHEEWKFTHTCTFTLPGAVSQGCWFILVPVSSRWGVLCESDHQMGWENILVINFLCLHEWPSQRYVCEFHT